MTAISGTFSDFKIIRGRKVAQLVIEVPLEQADAALKALGGVPQAHNERWVGLAPLTEEAATRGAAAASEPFGTPRDVDPHKPRKRFSEMSRAQQAGMLCQDEQFMTFYGYSDPEALARYVRFNCGVDSRADLDRDPNAGRIWDTMVTEYDAWRGKIARPEPAA